MVYGGCDQYIGMENIDPPNHIEPRSLKFHIKPAAVYRQTESSHLLRRLIYTKIQTGDLFTLMINRYVRNMFRKEQRFFCIKRNTKFMITNTCMVKILKGSSSSANSFSLVKAHHHFSDRVKGQSNHIQL